MAKSKQQIQLGSDENRPRMTDTLNSNRYFGILKHDCTVTEVPSNGSENKTIKKLKLGTLIQIKPHYMNHATDTTFHYFMIRDFDNWNKKYKTAVYKCSIDDYIAVTNDAWPYLLAIKNDASRLKFVENVNRNLFSLDTLSTLNKEIRIAAPRECVTDSTNYYEFVIRYVGLVRELGRGYYIGLEKKSTITMPAEFTTLSKHYKYGGEGIIVPANWIMIHLYNGEITNKKEDEKHKAATLQNCNLMQRDCLWCDKKFDENEFHNFRKCKHCICRKCAQATILKQINRQLAPKCPFCKCLLEDTEIQIFVNDALNMPIASRQLVPLAAIQRTTFECIICDETINLDQKMTLHQCGHDMCGDCLREKVGEQISCKIQPSCPLCGLQLGHNDQMALQIQIPNNYAIAPNANEKLLDNDNKCLVCCQRIVMRIELNKCKHAFCRSCMRTKIKIQEFMKLQFNCPHCRESIDLDQVNDLKKLSTQNYSQSNGSIGKC